MADVCACEIHESGRGLSPCMHHAQRIEEHQRMYNALQAIETGKVENPQGFAALTLGRAPYVRYWHQDHAAEVAR